MKIEIKNLKYYESMSEETSAFDCTIHIDGKPVLYANNRGTGGPNSYHLHENNKDYEGSPYTLAEDLDRFLSQKFEPSYYKDLDITIQYDLEQYIETNIALKTLEKDFKRIMKKLAIIESNEIYTFKLPADNINDTHISQIREKYKNAEILNTMDREQAFQRFVSWSGMSMPKKRAEPVSEPGI
jgi:hypothetical protein